MERYTYAHCVCGGSEPEYSYTDSLSPKMGTLYNNLQNITWVICCTFSR